VGAAAGTALSAAVDVIIDARFRGPTQSGNGGYSCGVLAASLGGAGHHAHDYPQAKHCG
jgi:hypothetical protein